MLHSAGAGVQFNCSEVSVAARAVARRSAASSSDVRRAHQGGDPRSAGMVTAHDTPAARVGVGVRRYRCARRASEKPTRSIAPLPVPVGSPPAIQHFDTVTKSETFFVGDSSRRSASRTLNPQV